MLNGLTIFVIMEDYKELNEKTKSSIISEIEILGFKKLNINDDDDDDEAIRWQYITENGKVYTIAFNKMVMHLISLTNHYISLNRVESGKAIVKFYQLIEKTVAIYDKEIKRKVMGKVRDFKIDSLTS